MNIQLTRLVVFAILMENGAGISEKAPKYIMEKWGSVESRDSIDSLIGLLDHWNHYKYVNWLATWNKQLDGLTAAAPAAPPAEAESVDQQQSVKSESVVIEAKDAGDVDKILKRIAGESSKVNPENGTPPPSHDR